MAKRALSPQRMIANTVIFLLLGLFVFGCDGPNQSDNGERTAEATGDEHVWQDTIDTLEKAKDAEALLKDAQAERAKQLDDE